jgi:cytochrome c oxidase subunit II
MFQDFPFFPEAASSVAGQVDAFYLALVAISAVMSLLIAGLIVFFAIKYRRRPGNEIPLEYKPYHWMEAVWIIVPFIVFMVIFVAGAKLYFVVQRPPADTLDMYVTGKQWMWKFQHPDGQTEINELHVPVNRPIRLTMASEDVIHSFFVPAFRVKRDVLPNRYTELWFEATRTGQFHLFCAEYCGTEHSRMIGTVYVMEPADYEEWLAGGGTGSAVEAGERLFTQYACDTCHMAGPTSRGPSLAGLYGHSVPLADGRTVIADDAYIRESILDPRAKIVAGYEPIMPSFRGQLTEENIMQLLAYIRSLSPDAVAPVSAAPLPDGDEANLPQSAPAANDTRTEE